MVMEIVVRKKKKSEFDKDNQPPAGAEEDGKETTPPPPGDTSTGPDDPFKTADSGQDTGTDGQGNNGPSAHGADVKPEKQDEFKHLATCLDKNQSYCNNYSIRARPGCKSKRDKYDLLENWYTITIKSKNDSYSVQVSQRRRTLCFPKPNRKELPSYTLENFKKHLLNCAATEAKHLMDYHKDDKKISFRGNQIQLC